MPESVQQASRTAVAAEVVDELKRRIRNGTYRAGDRLPSERSLSDELGVSRPTVREAIRALSAMNVVTQKHGSGVYVRSLEVFELLEPVRFALELSEPTLASLFEIRIAIEPLAARLAAERATRSEIDALVAIAAESQKPRLSVARFLELDTALHERLLGAARDDLLRTILSSLAFLSHESRLQTVRRPGVRAASVRDHIAITRAVARRDGQGAAAAMARHLTDLRAASGAVT